MNNQPIEIERKFLIKIPDINTLRSQPGYFETKITQLYISSPDGKSKGGRIRKSVYKDRTVYFKTYKRDITALKRIEIEREITQEEFQRLSGYIMEGTTPIIKVRHSFEFDEKLVEVDIYEFWSDRATAEVELSSEDEQLRLPNFIEVIKEITYDKRYRNFSLAKAPVMEKI